MIYNTLDNLPFKIFTKIHQTKEYSLLNIKDKSTEELALLFDDLTDEFNELDDQKSFENFLLEKEIAHLESKIKLLNLGVEILKFEVNEAVISFIEKEMRMKIRMNFTQYYYKDLERIEQKVNLQKVKVEKLREQLISKSKQSSPDETTYTIDDNLASISTILGVSFDFNTIPCTVYLAYKKQAQTKIKAQEEHLNKLKNKQ